jgi:hypothetical protein
LGTSGIFPQTAETMPHVTDIAGLLWGDRQTIDMDNGGNQLFVQAAQRFLISPLSADPIARDATSASPGQESWLLRRSHETRVNAIYNVIGRMVSERAGRARPNADVTSDIRSAAGIDLTNVSSDPSYREIQQALSKERFYNPEYISSLVDDPSAVVREQGAINAIRLQQLNDMYQRMEEMVFMQAAVYAADLDRQVPPDATEEIEKK